jgi:LuxR family maltose regulon positive regulatory protein
MAIPILHSKFSVPTYKAVLHRDRLFTRLDQALTHPLTLICADAGYGKSTLVATYLAQCRHPAFWLRLDDQDRHLDVLFAHLCAGLAEHLPSCQNRLTALAARLGQRQRSPAELAADFVAALYPPPDVPMTVVLDDFETVQDSAEVINAVHRLALLLPEAVHLLILGRTRPLGLPLTRLSLEGRLAEITRADLAFTREETQQLFADVYGITLSFGELQLLHQHCEGWPAGLRLVREALRRTTAPEERENFWLDLASMPDIFQYLWSEALANQPPQTQDFLLRTSVLASLEPSITDALLGSTNSHQILTQLTRTQLFTFAESDSPSARPGRGDQTYRYHALFRSFLHHQLEEREGPAALRDLHQRAAGLYEQRGRYTHAIGHYLASRDYAQAARVMSHVVDIYPPRTFLRLFDGWLEQQSPDAQMAYPSIFIRRVLPLETLERLTPALEQMLAEARASGDLLRQAHAHHRLASVPFYRNDTAPALHHYGQSAQLFHKLHDPVMEAFSLSQMGHLHWLAGNPVQARALCEQSLVLCHRHQLTMPRMHSLWVLAEIALGEGNLQRAERLGQMALQAGGEEEEPGAYAYLTSVLASVASARDDHSTAIRLAGQSLAYGQACQSRLDQGWGALCAGTAYLHAGDLTAAQPLLIQAAELLTDYAQLEMSALARLSALHLRLAQPDTARQRLTRALEIARGRNLDHPLLLEFAANPVLPAFALENDLHTDYLLTLVGRLPEPALEPVRRLLAEPGQPRRRALAQALAVTRSIPGAPPNRVQPSPPSLVFRLEFQTLGRFAVRHGEADLTPELNRRRSCRRLLLFLLANRHRAVPREQIIEALWPQVSPTSGTNRFHVALSWLRRILEPGLTSGSESRVILREVDRYKLASTVCQVDADEFIRLTSPILQGRRVRRLSPYHEQALVHATALYAGDFLEDYPYEEFLDGERARLREMQRLALMCLGDHYRLQRRAGRALEHYQTALILDPCCESVHRRLIFAHLLAGDCAAAARAWQECVTVLHDEIGVAPSPTTQAVARRMLDVSV